ncbi:MAG TPA: indole-3-glycerol-phosphate synthase [Gemmatimonadaceae bacterium]|nr:indole-3-glycerol-phosphate synthase [Gemmatimonadaceae bacterium]
MRRDLLEAGCIAPIVGVLLQVGQDLSLPFCERHGLAPSRRCIDGAPERAREPPNNCRRNTSRTSPEVQENFRWSPPGGPLGRLTRAAEERAATLRRSMPELRARALDAGAPPPFASSLRDGATVAVIAEIKRRSPSKGAINEGIRAGDRAALYADAGARALSILTEPLEFGGTTEDLLEVRARVGLPLLKKDFHVDEAQVWEARALGASAILFIARALAPHRLDALVETALMAGLEPLVEIRSEAELARAVATPATVIGVNARDLETLIIEPWVTERLLPAIPGDRVRVAESGMSSAEDVRRAAALGAHAVLVGSSLSAADDPSAALRALAAVSRGAHGG